MVTADEIKVYYDGVIGIIKKLSGSCCGCSQKFCKCNTVSSNQLIYLPRGKP